MSFVYKFWDKSWIKNRDFNYNTFLFLVGNNKSPSASCKLKKFVLEKSLNGGKKKNNIKMKEKIQKSCLCLVFGLLSKWNFFFFRKINQYHENIK